jgi:hypothetical protein
MMEPVAELLAASLVEVAWMTFLTDTTEGAAPDDLVRADGPDGPWRRVADVGWGPRGSEGLRATRDASSAITAFDDPRFPWWLQGQVVVLTRGSDPPRIPPAAVRGLVDDAWGRRAAVLVPQGVDGVLRPAVDGVAAGLLTFAADVRTEFLASIERHASSAAIPWDVLTEPEFEARLATG